MSLSNSREQRSDLFMTRLRALFAGVIAVTVVLSAMTEVHRVHANISRLVLHTRTCGTVSAFAVYDSYSEGIAPFWAVFSIDLNGNGIFGEANEPTRYFTLTPTI